MNHSFIPSSDNPDVDARHDNLVEAYILQLSDNQLYRFYRQLYHRIASGGGTIFGIDWHTVDSCWPEFGMAMRVCLHQMRLRSLDRPSNAPHASYV